MNCSEFGELLDNFAALDESRRKEMEEHAAECEQCQNELEFYKSIIAITASLPFPEPPNNLIESVNKRIDGESKAKRLFNNIVFEVRNNSRRYAAIAACLALGLVVGFNSSYIRDRLSDNDNGGVISEQTETTGREKPEKDKMPEITHTAEPKASEKAEKPEYSTKPVESTTYPRKTTEELKTEALAASDKPTAKSTAAPKATAKPAQKQTVERKASLTRPTVTIPKSVSVSATAKPKETEAPKPAAVTPAAVEISEAPTENIVADDTNSGKYSRIAHGNYAIPNNETAKTNQQEYTDGNVDDYSIKSDGNEVAMTSVEAMQTETKEYVIAGYDKVIVSSADAERARTLIDSSGIGYSNDHYQASYDSFYAFLGLLQENGIDYSYVQQYGGGDGVAFKLVSRG